MKLEIFSRDYYESNKYYCTHDVLGECPGLVGTNDGGIGHCLARTKDTDEEVFGGHSFRSKSEGKSHSERETFRNGHNDQCYGNDQDACEGDTLLGRSTMKTVRGNSRGDEGETLTGRIPRCPAVRRSES